MKKVLLFILIVIFVYALGGIIYIHFNKKEEVIKISNLDSIEGYNYTLKSNATKLYKDEFNLLKNNLESDEINNEEYVKSIAKLFIIDLYTLSNKINKYDVGGVDFIYPEALDNYKLNVEDTLYKYLEDNTNGNRNSELPEVSSVTIDTIEETKYKINNEEFNGYKVNLSIGYVKDLGYDNKGELIIIKSDKYYYVVEKN